METSRLCKSIEGDLGEGGDSGHSVLKSAFLGALAQRYVAGHRDQEFWHALRLRVLGVKI